MRPTIMGKWYWTACIAATLTVLTMKLKYGEVSWLDVLIPFLIFFGLQVFILFVEGFLSALDDFLFWWYRKR